MSAMASAAMIGSTVALAAAANFPAPFVQNGAANVAVVYGSGAQTDLVAVADITASLQATLASQTATTTSGPKSGDNFVSLDKSSDRLNLGNALNALEPTLDDNDMPVLLADGDYVADDKDEFDFEQKITLGSKTITHFRDSDYEEQQDLDEKTPVVGIKFVSGDAIFNYTLEFLDDAETDYVSTSDSDLQDIEGSDLPLFGKTYYVSDAKNGTAAATFGTFTLLDSANTGIVTEGQTITVTVGSNSYDVSIDFIDADSTALLINGQSTDDLAEGTTEKLSGGAYVGIRDVRKLAVAGEKGSVEFSIGSGKLEIASGSNIKLNDEQIDGVKGYINRGTPSSGTTQKIDKIVVEWVADDDMFLTADSDLTLPGFGGLKLSMDAFVRPTEEKVIVVKDDDQSFKINVPIEDGSQDLGILFGNTTSFTGIGEASDKRLATSGNGSITFFEQLSGSDYHTALVASYNTTNDAESYVLSFDVTEDTSNARNETSIKNVVTGATLVTDKKAGDTFDLGDIRLNIIGVHRNSSDRWVQLTAGTNVNFNTVYTKGGLRVYLPVDTGASIQSVMASALQSDPGAINFTANSTDNTGHNADSYYLSMDGEDKDDNIVSGTGFSFTIDQTSDGKYQATAVNTTGGNGAGAGTGGQNGLEVGDNSQIYEAYVVDDVAPRILHYTKPDEDWAEVFYPTGDSQSYASLYAGAIGARIVGGGATLGSVSVKDSEVASVSGKNLVVVGGSCVNSVAAELLGSSTPLCGDAWESATGVSAGEFLIQSFSRGGKVATLVAGYNAGDTTNAAKYIASESVDTSVGNKYMGTTATSAELIAA